METQTLETFKKCPNINAVKDNRVFCWRRQEWIELTNCNCNPNLRAEASQEW
jgi:hypothetical protein